MRRITKPGGQMIWYPTTTYVPPIREEARISFLVGVSYLRMTLPKEAHWLSVSIPPDQSQNCSCFAGTTVLHWAYSCRNSWTTKRGQVFPLLKHCIKVPVQGQSKLPQFSYWYIWWYCLTTDFSNQHKPVVGDSTFLLRVRVRIRAAGIWLFLQHCYWTRRAHHVISRG